MQELLFQEVQCLRNYARCYLGSGCRLCCCSTSVSLSGASERRAGPVILTLGAGGRAQQLRPLSYSQPLAGAPPPDSEPLVRVGPFFLSLPPHSAGLQQTLPQLHHLLY